MTVIRAAGPRRCLQLVRLRVDERGPGQERFAVRLLSAAHGGQVLFSARRFRAARMKFEEEADWRGFEVHLPPQVLAELHSRLSALPAGVVTADQDWRQVLDQAVRDGQ